MNQIEKRIPEWEAPESLVMSVMDAIERKERCRSYFTWPAVYRYGFSAIVGFVLLAISLVNLDTFFTIDITSFYSAINMQLNSLSQTSGFLLSIIYKVTLCLARHPVILGIMALVTISITVAWTESLTLLYRILSSHGREVTYEHI